jgi:predicted anti-sigma-YlaC factor YlaD
MDCIKYKELIQLYADGELDKSKEPDLFNHLGKCEECRLFFKALNEISSSITKEEFPADLERRIFSSLIEKGEKNKYSFFKRIYVPSLSYAAALIIIITGIVLYMKINEYKSEIAIINQQIKYQSQTIDLLYNSLSPTVVHAKYDHEIIIKTKL